MPTLFAFRLPRFAETKVDWILPLKSTLLENCTILITVNFALIFY